MAKLIKYITIILLLSFFSLGCFESSPYKEISPQELFSISTEKDVYHSNETLKVHLDFNSTKEGSAMLQVAGIKNLFGKAMVTESRDVIMNKGDNGFDFDFTTPSCEECDAVSPGVHYLNASVSIGGKTYETYKKIK